ARPPDLHSFPTRRSSDLDERGGATNVKLGLKDLTNREAQDLYIAECGKMLDDINTRFVRARLAHLSRDDADKAYARIKDGKTVRSEEHTSELQSRSDLVC